MTHEPICRNEEERRALEMFDAGYRIRNSVNKHEAEITKRPLDLMITLYTVGGIAALVVAVSGIAIDLLPELNARYPWYFFAPIFVVFFLMFNKAADREAVLMKKRQDRINEEIDSMIVDSFRENLEAHYRSSLRQA